MPSYHVIGARGFVGRRLFHAAQKVERTEGTSTHIGKEFNHLALEAPQVFDYGRISSGDIVFFTAAVSSPDTCARERARAWEINVEGTSCFISRVLSIGARIIFFSSDAVYGERDAEFDEDTSCAPLGDYGEMKRAVEERFESDPNFKTIRLSYVFGRDDKFTRYLIDCESADIPAEIFHPFYRAPIYYDDVIAGALALAANWQMAPGAVNFGGPAVLSRMELAEIIRDTALVKLKLVKIRPDDEFFAKRPRFISMRSAILPTLLGRPLRSISEAAKVELHGLGA